MMSSIQDDVVYPRCCRPSKMLSFIQDIVVYPRCKMLKCEFRHRCLSQINFLSHLLLYNMYKNKILFQTCPSPFLLLSCHICYWNQKTSDGSNVFQKFKMFLHENPSFLGISTPFQELSHSLVYAFVTSASKNEKNVSVFICMFFFVFLWAVSES